MSDDDAAAGSGEPAGGGENAATGGDDAAAGGDDAPARTEERDAAADGSGWLLVGVLVVAVLVLLLAGTALDRGFADRAAELGLGFAWLLAATYVGFRLEGSPGLRTVGALAFVVAAVAQFASLVAASAVLSTLRLAAVVAGAVILVVVVAR